MFNLLPCPNSIRYSWFWSGPQRQTRVDSSLWPPGTVTKLPSGTSPEPPRNPKIQNPKSQNPKSPKSQKPKSKIPTIQNPQNPKIQNPNFFGRILGILDLGFWIIRKQFFTWGLQRPKFWISAEDFGFWGFWILDFGDFRFWILDFGDLRFWILGILDFGEFGFWILGPEPQIQNPKSPIQTFLAKFSGFWILDRYVAILYVRPQRPIFWILAGILDFGFWGFWILDLDFGDFGSWLLRFWILDFWNIM